MGRAAENCSVSDERKCIFYDLTHVDHRGSLDLGRLILSLLLLTSVGESGILRERLLVDVKISENFVHFSLNCTATLDHFDLLLGRLDLLGFDLTLDLIDLGQFLLGIAKSLVESINERILGVCILLEDLLLLLAHG